MSTGQVAFREYADKSGIADSINRVLANLYDVFEEHGDPMGYVAEFLGAPPGVDADKLKDKNRLLQEEIARLEVAIAEKKKDAKA